MITISNNGQEIIETNYWDTPNAAAGYFYLSFNAGACRVLVPDSQTATISEMQTGKLAVITRGKLQGRDAYEVMFDDGSDSPYCIHTTTEQSDRLLPAGERGDIAVSVWAREGKQFEIPGKYRSGGTLPDMSPWSEK